MREINWQNDSAQEKRLHKEEKVLQNLSTSLRNRKTTHMFFSYQQSHSRISHFRPSIDFQNQENTFIVCFINCDQSKRIREKVFFCKED